MFCRHCGNEIPNGGKFCGRCGLPVETFNPPPASPNPPQPPVYHTAPKAKPARPWWKKPEFIIICCACLLVIVLSAILIGMLVGGGEEEPTIPNVVEELEPPAPHPEVPDAPDTPEVPDEPEEPEEPEGPLVTDAFYDDTHRNDEYNWGIFAIPQINLDSEEIRSLNEEIYRELYTELTRDLLKNWDNRSKKVTYDYYEVGDVLSVVVEVWPVDWEWTDYYVYNVSISEARVLSDDEVIAASGVEDFRKSAKQALETYFWESYPVDTMADFSGGDFFNEQLDRTRAQSNINEAVPYLNGRGELCVIAPIYSLAGADYYLHRVNLEDFDYQSRYSGYAETKKPASDGEYMIADSDSRRISESELHGLSEHECWLALNEIYARHGRIFARQEFADYFNSKSWYHGTIEGGTFDANVDNYLNDIEQENLATIIAYQKKMGWRES